MKSRRLALFVAIALGGGGFLSSAQSVSAADVVIDDAHPTVAADHKVGTGAAGGVVKDPSGTADVTGNTLTLTKRGFGGRLFGGYTAGSGNVTGNKVFIHNETAHVVQEKVYGGHANGSGNATSNTVTLTGGTFSDNIYGGSSVGGNATRNTVNLGDGTKAFAGTIHGTIYGGDGPGTGNHVTGNTLNVNADVTVGNIKNFETIHFNYNKNINTGNAILTLGGGSGATTVDWNGIHLNGTPERSKMTLMQNTNGININNYTPNKVIALDDKFESYITGETPHSPTKYSSIVYKRNQFAGVEKTVDTSDGIPGTSEVDVYGGESVLGNTTTGNHVTITRMTGHGKVYGGYTEGDGTTADVAKRYDSKGNKVTITGGAASELYGGYTSSTVGAATGNTVTVKGGTVRRFIYGGFAEHGDATGNTVNLGDAETGAVGNVAGSKIFGGRSRDNTKDQTTGNTLNVNANATALNIENFSTINFNLNAHMNMSNPLLTLNDPTNKTKLKSLSQLHVKNATVGGGTLIENARGIDVDNPADVGRTADKTETIIKRDMGGKKIIYRTYQFKEATTKDTDGTATWGGRSLIGNTTMKNEITLTGNHGAQNVYGGWTAKLSTITTEESAEGHSIDNKITFSGAATDTVGNMFGGLTVSPGGSATGNRAVLNSGKVTGSLTGGSVGATGSNATGNFVDINGGTVQQSTYGGSAGGTGKAENNTVTLTNGTVDADIFGGVASFGAATGNKVYIKGGSATNQDVYGGFSTNGDAPSNTVTVTGGSVRNVVGGKALGDASGNTVTVKANTGAVTGGDGTTTNNNTVNLEGNVTVNGTVTGGTQATGTNNTLHVAGENNSAANIGGFQNVKFNTNGVAANGTMLTLNGGAESKVDWNTLTVNGNGSGITLLKNNAGINLANYTDGAVKSGLSTDRKSEINVSVVKNAVTQKYTDIKYSGNQFMGVESADIQGTKVYGGISKAGNSTRENKISVNGIYDEVYGGHTSGSGTGEADKNNSYNNTVTITGGTIGTVYGGFTAAADGTTTGNTVTLAGGTVTGTVYGGNRTAKDNTLNVNTASSVGKIENFSKVMFKTDTAKLTLTQAGANFDLDTIAADFGATENEVTLVENTGGLTLAGGKTFKSDLSTVGTQTRETNLDVRDGNKKIVRYGYTVAGATAATTSGSEMWGGRSAAGNSTHDNKFTVNDGSGKTVYGGYTTGANGTATDKNDSHTNEVTLTGGTYTNVYGGWTNVGKAVSNTVNVTANAQGTLVGGYSASGEASNNVVSVMNAAFTGDITGGQGAVTNYNVIRLRNASVSGTITGGTAANGVDNTLDVSYGTGTSSAVGDITNIQRLHFDMENAPVRNANPLLKLTNVSGGDKNLTGMKFAVHRSGATQKLAKGDTFTLMENTTGSGHNITVGSGVTAEGRDGVSRNYTFDITQDPNDAHKLIATVTKAGMGEQSKSIVETRAGASAFLNDGADFLAGAGMDEAKKEARAAAQSGSAPYGIWAGMGGGSLRHETGSYVDMKGWNLGFGWARENAVQAGTLTFGPFVEYGRGSYDSYLDDGTHGSGKTSFFGAGMMAKLETGSHWIDGSLRIGRTKSDYTGLANYDTSNTYYGVQVGVGKDFHMSETDAVSAYVRYSYTHTAGTSAHLSSGETLDFDAVNSHRLRIGTRYTHGATTLSQFYAGLAWEYEFDGDARATSQGDSAPSPSLKGSSALLELGYRFAPKADSRMSYDLNLTGWQGKRQGITGGLSVKWAF